MLKRVQHPGKVLKRELAELGMSPTSLAYQIFVPPNRISQIIAGKRSVTGDTALRFGHWFGVPPEFWMNLQAQLGAPAYDPRALLCVWLYGFMTGVRSCRKLEVACRDQIPYLCWRRPQRLIPAWPPLVSL